MLLLEIGVIAMHGGGGLDHQSCICVFCSERKKNASLHIELHHLGDEVDIHGLCIVYYYRLAEDPHLSLLTVL